jgi:hypothetical protein
MGIPGKWAGPEHGHTGEMDKPGTWAYRGNGQARDMDIQAFLCPIKYCIEKSIMNYYFFVQFSHK